MCGRDARFLWTRLRVKARRYASNRKGPRTQVPQGLMTKLGDPAIEEVVQSHRSTSIADITKAVVGNLEAITGDTEAADQRRCVVPYGE